VSLVSALISCGVLVFLFNFLFNIPPFLCSLQLIMLFVGFTVLDAVIDKMMRECCMVKCIETQE